LPNLFSEEKTILYSVHQFWRARFDNTILPYATTKTCMLNYNFQIQASQDDDDGCQFVFFSYCNALL